jgi:hypothetical protein
MNHKLTPAEQEALRRIIAESPVNLVCFASDQGGYRVTEKSRVPTSEMLEGASSNLVRSGCAYCWTPCTDTPEQKPHIGVLMACEILFDRLSAEQVENCIKSWITLFGEHVVEVVKDRIHEDQQIAREMSAQAALHEKHGAVPGGLKDTMNRLQGVPDHTYLAQRFDCDETNLWLLAEESGEVVRSCGKIGRWGYDHVHQITGESGMRLLEGEVGDFLAIVEIMIARGHFTRDAIHKATHAKLERLEDWYDAPWTPADTAQAGPDLDRKHVAHLLGREGLHRVVVEAFDGKETYTLRARQEDSAGSSWTTSVQAIWDADEEVFRELKKAVAPIISAEKREDWDAQKRELLARMASADARVGVDYAAPGTKDQTAVSIAYCAPSSLRVLRAYCAGVNKPKFCVTRLDGNHYEGWLIDEPARPDGRMRMVLDTDQLIWVRSCRQELHETIPPATSPNTVPLSEVAHLAEIGLPPGEFVGLRASVGGHVLVDIKANGVVSTWGWDKQKGWTTQQSPAVTERPSTCHNDNS